MKSWNLYFLLRGTSPAAEKRRAAVRRNGRCARCRSCACLRGVIRSGRKREAGPGGGSPPAGSGPASDRVRHVEFAVFGEGQVEQDAKPCLVAEQLEHLGKLANCLLGDLGRGSSSDHCRHHDAWTLCAPWNLPSAASETISKTPGIRNEADTTPLHLETQTSRRPAAQEHARTPRLAVQ